MPVLAFLLANKDNISKVIKPDDIKKLIGDPALLNKESTDHETPLLIAISMGNFAVADLLVKSGASMMLPVEYDGPSLLELALGHVIRGIGLDSFDLFERIEFVEKLIADTDNVNIPNRDGNPPIVQLLLHRPLYGNANNRALAEGRARLLKALIAKGATPNVYSHKKQTPLGIALSHAYDYSEATKALLDSQKLNNESLNYLDMEGWHPLFRAIAHREMMIVLLLIRQGSDIHYTDKNGNTALHICARFPDAQIMEILLSHKLDCKVLNSDQDTPLHLAAAMGDNETCLQLIQAGADINAQNKYQQTPLMVQLFTKEPKIDTIKLLLLKGANPHLSDAKGISPLQLVKDNLSFHQVIRYSIENYDKLEEKKKHAKIVEPLPKAKKAPKIVLDIEPDLEVEGDMDLELDGLEDLDADIGSDLDLGLEPLEEVDLDDLEEAPLEQLDIDTDTEGAVVLEEENDAQMTKASLSKSKPKAKTKTESKPKSKAKEKVVVDSDEDFEDDAIESQQKSKAKKSSIKDKKTIKEKQAKPSSKTTVKKSTVKNKEVKTSKADKPVKITKAIKAVKIEKAKPKPKVKAVAKKKTSDKPTSKASTKKATTKPKMAAKKSKKSA